MKEKCIISFRLSLNYHSIIFLCLAIIASSSSSPTTTTDSDQSTYPRTISQFQNQLFSQNDQLLFTIDESHLNHRIIIESSVILPGNGKSPFELLMFAAEPNTEVPDYYAMLFSHKSISEYENSQIHIDYEGFATMNPFQFLDITVSSPQMIGDWTIALYDLGSDQKTTYITQVHVIDLGEQTAVYCPNNCNKAYSPNNTCLGEQNNWCQCYINYTGKSCSMQLLPGKENEKTTIGILPQTWLVWWINARDYAGLTTQIEIEGTTTLIAAIHLGTKGSSEINVPNILTSQIFEVSFTSYGKQHFPIESEAISKLLAINSSDVNAAETISELSSSIMIGLYNPNAYKSISFLFSFTAATNESTDGFFNQTAIFILIAVGGMLVFCVSPLAYIFLRRKKQSSTNESTQGIHQTKKTLENRRSLRRNQDPPAQDTSSFEQNEHGQINPLQQQIIHGGGGGGGSSPQLSIPVSSQIILQNNGGDSNKPVKKIVPITQETLNMYMQKQLHVDITRLYPTLKEECGDECMVCLEVFVSESECRITPCFHLFHSDCLESWFEKHSTCPYCRAPCNRKGITSQLSLAQQNPYISRISQKQSVQQSSAVLPSDEMNKPIPTINSKFGEFAGSILSSITKPIQNLFRSATEQKSHSQTNNNNPQMPSQERARQLTSESGKVNQNQVVGRGMSLNQNDDIQSQNCLSSNVFIDENSHENQPTQTQIPNMGQIIKNHGVIFNNLHDSRSKLPQSGAGTIFPSRNHRQNQEEDIINESNDRNIISPIHSNPIFGFHRKKTGEKYHSNEDSSNFFSLFSHQQSSVPQTPACLTERVIQQQHQNQQQYDSSFQLNLQTRRISQDQDSQLAQQKAKHLSSVGSIQKFIDQITAAGTSSASTTVFGIDNLPAHQKSQTLFYQSNGTFQNLQIPSCSNQIDAGRSEKDEEQIENNPNISEEDEEEQKQKPNTLTQMNQLG